MTSLDREVVRRKLAHIAEALEALRPLAGLSFPEYAANSSTNTTGSMISRFTVR